MSTFTYDHSIQSPTSTTSDTFGFSPDGKYLALGDTIARQIHILDVERQEVTCIPTVAPPTSFVWDTVEPRKFIIGFSDGTLAFHSFGGTEVFKTRFDSLKDRGTVQSLALSRNGLTLAIAVSHGDVYLFYRKACADSFELIANATSEYNFKSTTTHRDPPNPRSLCFTADGALFISYEWHGVLTIPALDWSSLRSATATSISGYIESGELALLRAVTSADDQKYPPGLYNFWVYHKHSHGDGDVSPLLFINRGATVLRVDPRGSVLLSDSITRELFQQLDDNSSCTRYGSSPIRHEAGGDGTLHAAYFATNKGQWIVTIRSGRNGNVKFWYADPATKREKVKGRFSIWLFHAIVTIVLLVLVLYMFGDDGIGQIGAFTDSIVQYQHAIVEYHKTVNTRVDRLREEVVVVMGEVLKGLESFSGE